MKLLIDIGNTSAKIAIAKNGEIVHFERLAESWQSACVRIIQQYDIKSIRISTVAAYDSELHKAIDALNLPAIWLTAKTPCAIKGIPQGMGADRVAADIGAYSQNAGRTTLIIDAGTCITYDLISSEGTFIGGIISPGVQLRLNAMHEHTALLPQLYAVATTPLMGTETKTAMMSSAVNGTRFEIEGYIRHFQRLYPDLCVFTTGGNNFSELAEELSLKITNDPYLLLKGLEAL